MDTKVFYLVLFGFLILMAPRASGQETEANIAEQNPGNLFDMPLEELMEIRIESVATITKTNPRLVPSATTTISEEEIQASGARNLFELLDIYVPNLQWLRNHWETDNLGLRGVMSDKEDKYLLLVNGRIMNERTHLGVVSERDQTTLKDIHHIDIIRGPGSAMYGPGAVSMVISIVTHNSDTFEGTDVTTRVGSLEEFYSAEIRHGKKFSDGEGGYFLYGGITHYPGADPYDAPYVIGMDLPSGSDYSWWDPAWGVYTGPESLPGDGTEAGTPVKHSSIPGDGETHRSLPRIKLYAEIKQDDWDYWIRYTRGGQKSTLAPGYYMRSDWGWADWSQPLGDRSYGYQQLTFFVGRKQEISDQTRLDYSFSYDLFDFERIINGDIIDAYREDKYFGKIMLHHDISKRHRLAIGVELEHHELGYPSLCWPNYDNAEISQIGGSTDRWSTNLYSWVGEYQWTISHIWTAFFGARLDDHTYTDKMFSPRMALVCTPNEKDAYKFLWSRSVRSNFEDEMRAQAVAGTKNDSAPEKLDSFEIRYERNHSRNLYLAASAYWYYNLELLSWSSTESASVPVGTQKHWGFELEAAYHNDKTRIGISHAYTKLRDFELEPGQSSLISAKPYGYGDDLALWSNHMTKLTASHKLDEKWTLDGSMRIYWQFPGMKDYAQYTYDQASADYKPTDPGWSDAFKGNYYLNLGLQYQPNDDLTFRIDGYNLLGMFDKDLNKRNYGSDFRSHAAAVACSMTYKF